MTAEEWAGYIIGQLYLPDVGQHAWLGRQRMKIPARLTYYFWRFVHHGLAHNCYWVFGEWAWVDRFHHWSGKRWGKD